MCRRSRWFWSCLARALGLLRLEGRSAPDCSFLCRRVFCWRLLRCKARLSFQEVMLCRRVFCCETVWWIQNRRSSLRPKCKIGDVILASSTASRTRRGMESRPKDPKSKENDEIKSQKAKCTEIKAQKAKMKGKQGPRGQNERNQPSAGGARDAPAKNPWV